MDPITIAVVVVVGAAVLMGRNAHPAQQAAVAQQEGALPFQPGPAPELVPSVAPAMFADAHVAAVNYRNALGNVLTNTFATAKQRSTGLTGGMDPAFVTSGSASAARDLVTRGLTVTRDATVKVADLSWQLSPLGMAGRTQTGQAVQQLVTAGAKKTAAEVIAAGGTVADATAQAATNAANSAAAAASSADAATAAFINRNSPF